MVKPVFFAAAAAFSFGPSLSKKNVLDVALPHLRAFFSSASAKAKIGSLAIFDVQICAPSQIKILSIEGFY